MTARSSRASGIRDRGARRGSQLTGPAQGDGRPSGDRPLHELLRDLAEGTAKLVRDEIALAKLELRRAAERIGAGAGAFAVAGLLAFAVLGLLIATMVLALDLVLPAWAATLVVAVLLALVAGGAAAAGRALIAKGPPDVAEQVREGLREDVAVIRARVADEREDERS